MSEKKDLQKASITVDTGILIELLEDSDLGKVFYQKVLEKPQFQNIYISPLTDTELKYIFCRRNGYNDAKELVLEFLKDFIICSESELRDEAFRLKCNFPISIADCYSLAVGKVFNIPVYMIKEKEIEKVIDKLLSMVKVIFIDDI
jgi:hypothetical protein